MDWNTMSPSPDRKHPTYYRKILETINDFNLTQMVNLSTRENNILDLFLTTNPTLVNILPGISDHNIVEVKVHTSTKICYQKPLKIPLYKKANWERFKQSMDTYHQEMLKEGKYSTLSIEDLWVNSSSTLNNLSEKFIPSKMSPLDAIFSGLIKRIIRRRDRAFKSFRKSNKSSDRKYFMVLKHTDSLNVNQPDASPSSKPNTKKFYSLLKHSKQDSASLPPLKYRNKLYTDETSKATALNKQFQSTVKITKECQIYISANGIEKLLTNLNPHK
ncbi:LOW QUALITY PROTEIN: hypothetical protein MAR_008286, partial [Mya arenaria]